MSKVKISVMYPASEGSTFDMDYYRTTHREIVERIHRPLAFEIDQGLEGQPYMAVGHLIFDSMESMQAGMSAPDAAEAAADLPNFTNVQPQVQIGLTVD